MDGTKFANPENFQGIWFCLHLFSINCDTQEMKNSFINFVNILVSNFKCEKCKVHFRDYLNKNPLDESNLFKWTWEFHNKVNKFLGKKLPTYDDAYQYYNNAEVGMCEHCNGDIQGYLKFLYLDTKNFL